MKFETCTKNPGQDNNCWSKFSNPLANISLQSAAAAASNVVNAQAQTTITAPTYLSSTTSTTPPGSVSGTTPSGPSATDSAETQSPTSAKDAISGSAGLSRGTIAGAAVGATFGAVLCAVVAFLIWRRYTRKRARQTDGSGYPFAHKSTAVEADGSGYPSAHKSNIAEADGGWRGNEVGDTAGSSERHDVHSSLRSQELPG